MRDKRIELGDGVRALARLKCGNMEEWNKYWLEEEIRRCSFCRERRDNMRHYMEECKEIGEWFRVLGENKEEI